jgi:hypothetical protein
MESLDLSGFAVPEGYDAKLSRCSKLFADYSKLCSEQRRVSLPAPSRVVADARVSQTMAMLSVLFDSLGDDVKADKAAAAALQVHTHRMVVAAEVALSLVACLELLTCDPPALGPVSSERRRSGTRLREH